MIFFNLFDQIVLFFFKFILHKNKKKDLLFLSSKRKKEEFLQSCKWMLPEEYLAKIDNSYFQSEEKDISSHSWQRLRLLFATK